MRTSADINRLLIASSVSAKRSCAVLRAVRSESCAVNFSQLIGSAANDPIYKLRNICTKGSRALKTRIAYGTYYGYYFAVGSGREEAKRRRPSRAFKPKSGHAYILRDWAVLTAFDPPPMSSESNFRANLSQSQFRWAQGATNDSQTPPAGNPFSRFYNSIGDYVPLRSNERSNEEEAYFALSRWERCAETSFEARLCTEEPSCSSGC